MSKKKTHGLRNKNLSEDLFSGRVYYDWSVTIAFYSAIHFVEDKILPCEVHNHSCKNINDVKSAYNMNGRHAARERLVFEKLDLETGAYYKWLDDKSRFSRYTSFKVTSGETEKALLYLSEIYKVCYSKD